MTRDEAMLKLLAVEPETRDRLIDITGWPMEETTGVLDRLVAQKRVTYVNLGGRRYYPAINGETVSDL